MDQQQPVEVQADLLEVSRNLTTYILHCPTCNTEHRPVGNTPRGDIIPPLAEIACACGGRIKPVNDRFIAAKPQFALNEN